MHAEPETGRGVMVAAERDLKSRGVSPHNASYEQLLDALVRCSS
jgi:hypothetical protein